LVGHGEHQHDIEDCADTFGGGSHGDVAFVDDLHLDVSLVALGKAGGLEESLDRSLRSRSFHQLDFVVVADKDVRADGGLDEFGGLAGEGSHGGVGEGEDGDGVKGVNFVNQIGFG